MAPAAAGKGIGREGVQSKGRQSASAWLRRRLFIHMVEVIHQRAALAARGGHRDARATRSVSGWGRRRLFIHMVDVVD